MKPFVAAKERHAFKLLDNLAIKPDQNSQQQTITIVVMSSELFMLLYSDAWAIEDHGPPMSPPSHKKNKTIKQMLFCVFLLSFSLPSACVCVSLGCSSSVWVVE